MVDNAALIQEITKRLDAVIEITTLNIIDDSAKHIGHAGNTGGAHFTIHITSKAFIDISPIARHRLVYEPLQDLIPDKIHALSIKANIPEDKS